MSLRLRSLAAGVGGFVVGIVVVLVGLYFWPFAHVGRGDRVMRGLASEANVEAWSFDGRADGPGSMLAASHSGKLPLTPFPTGTPLMTEPAIRSGLAVITRLRDSTGEIVGIASELESGHEDSNLLRGRVMGHTTWTVVLPGRGAFIAYQTEDNWTLATRIAGPAMLRGVPWRGEWFTVNTLGPLANGHGRIIGASGEFAERSATFVETAVLREFRPEGAMDFTMDLRLVSAGGDG